MITFSRSNVSEGVCSFALFRLAALLGMILAVVPASAAAVSCPTGPVVDDAKYCAFFFYYRTGLNPVDPRIGIRLGAKNTDETHSFALIVGVSKYPNLQGSDLPPAANDVKNLKTFFRDNQQFDEIIVLEDGDVTRENIDYFLSNYLLRRASDFGGKSRLVFTYSGHGTPQEGALPPSLVLPAADSLVNPGNLYSLNILRISLQDLATGYFHVLALINACHGGGLFSVGWTGQNPNVSDKPGAFAMTAGAADDLVYSLGGPADGSIFFDTILDGIRKGTADRYPTVVDANGVVVLQGGVVRLDPLFTYLTTRIEDIGKPQSNGGVRKYADPLMGPVEPDGSHAIGAFFFLSPETRPPKIAGAGAKLPQIPAGSVSSIPGRPDLKVFNSPAEYAVRGIDVSAFSGDIDWARVRAEANVDFAYIKAASAAGIDQSLERNWQQAKANGIARGAYYTFSYCEPVGQQMSIIKERVPSDGEMPIAIDVEDYAGVPQFKEADCAQAMSFEDLRKNVAALAGGVLEWSGKVPLIYSDRQVLQKLSDERFSRFMVWLALYKRNPTTGGGPDVKLTGGNPWTLWQYSENAKVPGIGKPVDQNVFFGSRAQFADFLTGKSNVALAAVTNASALGPSPNR